MAEAAPADASMQAQLQSEVVRLYDEVLQHPEGEFHFFHGRAAAERFGYAPAWLDRAAAGAVRSFAGVGNPHERAGLRPGETVVDLGCGAGLDAIVASWAVGPAGRVVGVDVNPLMCRAAEAHARESGARVECLEGRAEDIPLPDASADVLISNGVVNLSLQKRRVFEEVRRVVKPGGRLSLTDIVSAKQLSQSIVNDPKLWAS